MIHVVNCLFLNKPSLNGAFVKAKLVNILSSLYLGNLWPNDIARPLITQHMCEFIWLFLFIFQIAMEPNPSDEEPYRDPRAIKTLGTLTEKEIYGELNLVFSLAWPSQDVFLLPHIPWIGQGGSIPLVLSSKIVIKPF